MIPRSLRLAYVIPPIVAVVLACTALLQLDQRAVLGPSYALTINEGEHPRPNGQVADALARVADRTGATLVRVVADRTAPATKRTVLTTAGHDSAGSRWLSAGYDDFDRSMRTTVRPISDLDRFDLLATYEVHGSAADARAFAAAFTRSGYESREDRIPSTTQLAVQVSASSNLALLGVAALACSVSCLTGTLGTPRRAALRRLSGHSWMRIAGAEMAAAASTLWAGAALAGPVGIGLAFYNGWAQIDTFVGLTGVFWSIVLAPVCCAHLVGCLGAARMPVPGAIRGSRPAGFLVRIVQIARVPASLILVSAVFSCVGSLAVLRAGEPERELRAAGSAVQLGVTPDPRPGQDTQAYWDRIGRMARDALRSGDAFLAATGDISAPGSRKPFTAFFVDAGYLRGHPIRAADGHRITDVGAHRVDVFVPAALAADRAEIESILRGWDLRAATPPLVDTIRSGVLAPDQEPYAFPDESKPTAWLPTSTIVVLPPGSDVISDDLLSAWVSTGDVVFRDEASAMRVIHAHGLDREFSVIAPVGQGAAERARSAAVRFRVDVLTAGAGIAVAVLAATLSIVVHRRRSGDVVFTRHTAGWSFIRANRALLVVEMLLVAVVVLAATNAWWGGRATANGLHSALDPVARSATSAVIAALATGGIVAVAGVVTLVITGRRAVRDHGKET